MVGKANFEQSLRKERIGKRKIKKKERWRQDVSNRWKEREKERKLMD